MSSRLSRTAVIMFFVSVLGSLGGTAEAVPWALFQEEDTETFCDVVNAANTELVIDAETGEFIIVRGADIILTLTFVDDDLSVFFDDEPAGFIDFADDAQGLRTLWWFTEAGDVANVNEFTGEPTQTGLSPDNFEGARCDACELWDDPFDCLDEDDDGVDPRFDLCPDTPFDEVADADGCSCSQLDDDGDGINNCFDLCPGSFEEEAVDADGCACAQLDDDDDGINNCFDLCPDTFEDENADDDGCACAQLDDDDDGINNCFDLCPSTREGASVDDDGCSSRGFAPGGGLCGAFGMVSLFMMFCGLVGLRLRPRRRSRRDPSATLRT